MRDNSDYSIIKKKKLFLFDMDGTIYHENCLFPSVTELTNLMIKTHKKYAFITNNSSKSVSDYVIKLSNMGIQVNRDNFVTSTMIAAEYINDNYQNKIVFCVGTKSFVSELKSYGVKTSTSLIDNPEVVLVGYDTELTYAKLWDASLLLKNSNIPFLATNVDLRCPVSFGFVPDCGSICEVLSNTSNRLPTYLGKPSRSMVDIAMKRFGINVDETIVIGDRLYTDIACGINAGVSTAVVLTGETKISDVDKSDYRPDYVFESVSDILSILSEN